MGLKIGIHECYKRERDRERETERERFKFFFMYYFFCSGIEMLWE